MATSYDYRYHEVGQPEGSIQNTTDTFALLTGLTSGLSYEVDIRVRETDGGAAYLGLWSSLVFEASSSVAVALNNLNHSVTLNAVSAVTAEPPVFVNLGHVSATPVLEGLTIEGGVTAQIHDLNLHHIASGTNTLFQGIDSTSYSLAGLTYGDDYEVKLRLIETDAGATYLGLWSDAVGFTAGALSDIIINLNDITLSVGLNPLESYVALTPVSVDLALINSNPAINAVESYVALTPVSVDLGTVNPSVAPNTITSYIANPTAHVDLGSINPGSVINAVESYIANSIGTFYVLEVEEVGVGKTYISSIANQSYALSVLTTDSTYNVRVQAYVQEGDVKYYSPWSAATSFTAGELFDIIVNLGVVSNPLTFGAWDHSIYPIVMESLNFTNQLGGSFKMLGTLSHNIASMTATVDGVPMGYSFDGFDWEIILQEDALQINQMEELDGPQPLIAGNTVLEIN
jgi:hypothetical protein